MKMGLRFCLFITILVCGCAQAPLRSPDQISYENTPGYSSSKSQVLLEWEARSQESIDEEASVPATIPAPSGLRLRWFGTTAFELSDEETTVLIDPFVSRPSQTRTLLAAHFPVDTEAVDYYLLKDIDLKKLKVILVSHGHHDHVMDVPYILMRYPKSKDRPLVVGTPDVPRLYETHKNRERLLPWLKDGEPLATSPTRVIEAYPGWPDHVSKDQKMGIPVGQYGKFKVTAFISDHGKYDDYPFFMVDLKTWGRAPLNILQYGAHDRFTLSYLVEYEGLKFYFSDSPTLEGIDQITRETGKVDFLFKGIASRKHKGRVLETIQRTSPRYFIPTHFDNFFYTFRDMEEFKTKVYMPFDQIKYEDFLTEYEEYALRTPASVAHTKLRLMRPLFYYSLEEFLRPEWRTPEKPRHLSGASLK